jgi:hypothetical protein
MPSQPDDRAIWVLERCLRIFCKPDCVLDADDDFSGKQKARLVRSNQMVGQIQNRLMFVVNERLYFEQIHISYLVNLLLKL